MYSHSNEIWTGLTFLNKGIHWNQEKKLFELVILKEHEQYVLYQLVEFHKFYGKENHKFLNQYP